jgi:hypothetical protein
MSEQMRPERRRRTAVRLGIPVLIVGVLTLVALWRIAPPPPAEPAVGTAGRESRVLEPLTRLSDVLTANAVGRRASLEDVPVRHQTGRSTFWVGGPDHDLVFVVLDEPARGRARVPDPGTRVTLAGAVEPVPDDPSRAWAVDPITARMVRERGVYLRATEMTLRGR